jgi:hypothetical protein
LAQRQVTDFFGFINGLLGMRWLKIIAAMIRNQTPYDAAVHTRNQLQHGSWVMQLQPVQIIKKDAS